MESLPTDRELTSRQILRDMAADIVDQCWSVHDQDSARMYLAEVLALIRAARVVRDLMSGKAVVQVVQSEREQIVPSPIIDPLAAAMEADIYTDERFLENERVLFLSWLDTPAGQEMQQRHAEAGA